LCDFHRHTEFLFVRRTYFTETFSDKDKFATELKDYPTIVEGLEGEFAKELFRYAYNIDQMGYFKYSLEYINSLGAQHRFVEKEFQEELKNAGVPSVIGIEFLTNVHESMLGDFFGEIVSSYNDLYNAYFKVTPGTISLGQYYPPKYSSFLKKVREIASPVLVKGMRVEWKIELSPQELSGWRATTASRSIDRCGASALEADRAEGIESILS
jgi:hypothetical protein